jgi:hypothetical protein
VRLSSDSSLDDWLGGVTGAAEQFDWGAGNRSKGQKRGVELSEIVYRLIDRGDLQHTRVSNAIRISSVVLSAYLTSDHD